eukprot:GHVL01009354.1.p1 GENE.GHVL01009354.1~~GHVL01009354.1.p1  ORF type:complete len:2158 (-),score=355.01 GHVL01009354.1:1337-7258(-)
MHQTKPNELIANVMEPLENNNIYKDDGDPNISTNFIKRSNQMTAQLTESTEVLIEDLKKQSMFEGTNCFADAISTLNTSIFPKIVESVNSDSSLVSDLRSRPGSNDGTTAVMQTVAPAKNEWKTSPPLERIFPPVITPDNDTCDNLGICNSENKKKIKDEIKISNFDTYQVQIAESPCEKPLEHNDGAYGISIDDSVMTDIQLPNDMSENHYESHKQFNHPGAALDANNFRNQLENEYAIIDNKGQCSNDLSGIVHDSLNNNPSVYQPDINDITSGGCGSNSSQNLSHPDFTIREQSNSDRDKRHGDIEIQGNENRMCSKEEDMNQSKHKMPSKNRSGLGLDCDRETQKKNSLRENCEKILSKGSTIDRSQCAHSISKPSAGQNYQTFHSEHDGIKDSMKKDDRQLGLEQHNNYDLLEEARHHTTGETHKSQNDTIFRQDDLCESKMNAHSQYRSCAQNSYQYKSSRSLRVDDVDYGWKTRMDQHESITNDEQVSNHSRQHLENEASNVDTQIFDRQSSADKSRSKTSDSNLCNGKFFENNKDEHRTEPVHQFKTGTRGDNNEARRTNKNDFTNDRREGRSNLLQEPTDPINLVERDIMEQKFVHQDSSFHSQKNDFSHMMNNTNDSNCDNFCFDTPCRVTHYSRKQQQSCDSIRNVPDRENNNECRSESRAHQNKKCSLEMTQNMNKDAQTSNHRGYEVERASNTSYDKGPPSFTEENESYLKYSKTNECENVSRDNNRCQVVREEHDPMVQGTSHQMEKSKPTPNNQRQLYSDHLQAESFRDDSRNQRIKGSNELSEDRAVRTNSNRSNINMIEDDGREQIKYSKSPHHDDFRELVEHTRSAEYHQSALLKNHETDHSRYSEYQVKQSLIAAEKQSNRLKHPKYGDDESTVHDDSHIRQRKELNEYSRVAVQQKKQTDYRCGDSPKFYNKERQNDESVKVSKASGSTANLRSSDEDSFQHEKRDFRRANDPFKREADFAQRRNDERHPCKNCGDIKDDQQQYRDSCKNNTSPLPPVRPAERRESSDSANRGRCHGEERYSDNEVERGYQQESNNSSRCERAGETTNGKVFNDDVAYLSGRENRVRNHDIALKNNKDWLEPVNWMIGQKQGQPNASFQIGDKTTLKQSNQSLKNDRQRGIDHLARHQKYQEEETYGGSKRYQKGIGHLDEGLGHRSRNSFDGMTSKEGLIGNDIYKGQTEYHAIAKLIDESKLLESIEMWKDHCSPNHNVNKIGVNKIGVNDIKTSSFTEDDALDVIRQILGGKISDNFLKTLQQADSRINSTKPRLNSDISRPPPPSPTLEPPTRPPTEPPDVYGLDHGSDNLFLESQDRSSQRIMRSASRAGTESSDSFNYRNKNQHHPIHGEARTLGEIVEEDTLNYRLYDPLGKDENPPSSDNMPNFETRRGSSSQRSKDAVFYQQEESEVLDNIPRGRNSTILRRGSSSASIGQQSNNRLRGHSPLPPLKVSKDPLVDRIKHKNDDNRDSVNETVLRLMDTLVSAVKSSTMTESRKNTYNTSPKNSTLTQIIDKHSNYEETIAQQLEFLDTVIVPDLLRKKRGLVGTVESLNKVIAASDEMKTTLRGLKSMSRSSIVNLSDDLTKESKRDCQLKLNLKTIQNSISSIDEWMDRHREFHRRWGAMGGNSERSQEMVNHLVVSGRQMCEDHRDTDDCYKTIANTEDPLERIDPGKTGCSLRHQEQHNERAYQSFEYDCPVSPTFLQSDVDEGHVLIHKTRGAREDVGAFTMPRNHSSAIDKVNDRRKWDFETESRHNVCGGHHIEKEHRWQNRGQRQQDNPHESPMHESGANHDSSNPYNQARAFITRKDQLNVKPSIRRLSTQTTMQAKDVYNGFDQVLAIDDGIVSRRTLKPLTKPVIVDKREPNHRAISAPLKALYRQVALACHYKSMTVKQVFEAYDPLHTGSITRDDFLRAFRDLRMGMTRQAMQEMLWSAQTKENGKIDYKSFATRVVTAVST